ncbi:hypothetical protein O3M35_003363 [Rhynocoris fuscipes]|uniref:G patch domain-containing protein 11 n=1 Tax=Rhynocoris fuscipes TaxID=488301 RepID=A0AAW1CJV8_9HEMI
MSSDEEVDYMSDAFVCTNPDADIRPGLNPKLRKIKEQPKPVSVKVLEKEKRDDGLQTPLTSENKGFAMLAKMGFKPGSGLGKSGDGRAEPVPINVKTNREGLGRNLIRREVMELKAKLRKESKKNDNDVDDYRKRIVEEANIRTCKIDLSRSQKACYNLDTKEGILEPDEDWFWHDFHKNNSEKNTEDCEEEENEDDLIDIELSVEDKLRILTLYLRRTYCYCIWCGTQFDDEKDLQQECPGPTREDH